MGSEWRMIALFYDIFIKTITTLPAKAKGVVEKPGYFDAFRQVWLIIRGAEWFSQRPG
jgi:hypothetical protein